MDYRADVPSTQSATTNTTEVIGAGRDAGAVAEMMLGGRSVIGGGPLGAGKSFFLERVAAELTARGVVPLVVHGAAALRGVAFGALDAVSDTGVAGLRSGETAPRILLVDDAHELDAESVAVILRAIYGRRTAAFIALTEPRMQGRIDGDTAADAFNETWLRGIADRLDLAALHDAESARLLDVFTERRPFDSVTRAAVIWQADGSRMLLRALADVAASALAAGRDPLVAIDDVPPHSRLATALHAHIREFDDQSRRALILIDSARGITWTDAARFIPSATLESLRAVGLLHDDGSARHLLSANRAIARAVERAWGATRAQDVRHSALSRLVTDQGKWWSTPLARNLAEQWLRSASSPDEVDGVPAKLIERVLVDAAREANDRGHGTMARAYAEWGQTTLQSPALALELGYADLLLGRRWPDDPQIDDLDDDGRLRARQIVMALQLQEAPAETWMVLGRAAGDSPVAPETGVTVDPWGTGLDAARLAVADLRFGDALAAVTDLSAERAEARAIDRIGADLIEATAHAYLGDEAAMLRSLSTADREFRSAAADIDDIVERLSARCLDLAARTVVGAADDDTLRALAAERDDAVRRGGMSLTLAGYAGVLADARNGRALEALRELDAAMQRSGFSGGAATGMIQLDTAYALGAFGFAPEARLVFSTIDEPRYPTRLYTHASAATAATVAASEREWDEARACAAQAWELSAESDARSLQARDLHRLAVLRHPEFPDAAEQLRALAAVGETPIVRVLAESVGRLSDAGDLDVVSALAHLRLAICPRDNRARAAAHARIARPWADWTPPRSPSTLTPRESEIASLVHQGLSNREIAGTLFLSVRTVESHIYQARAKVGARTRRELGSIVSRVGGRRSDGTGFAR